ncbi:MAG: hypothetical protein U9Q06_00335 [Nanoarchaeota archaeon]|nr:hypothetical protein [Nanoarchaeota archaeon]
MTLDDTISNEIKRLGGDSQAFQGMGRALDEGKKTDFSRSQIAALYSYALPDNPLTPEELGVISRQPAPDKVEAIAPLLGDAINSAKEKLAEKVKDNYSGIIDDVNNPDSLIQIAVNAPTTDLTGEYEETAKFLKEFNYWQQANDQGDVNAYLKAVGEEGNEIMMKLAPYAGEEDLKLLTKSRLRIAQGKLLNSLSDGENLDVSKIKGYLVELENELEGGEKDELYNLIGTVYSNQRDNGE